MKAFVMGTHFEIGVKPQDMVVTRTTTTIMRLKDYTVE
nr:pectin lyase-like superfamily protein [Tanacetum cinerariifolium]